MEDTTAKRASAGDGIDVVRAGWTFGGETPKTFDAHVRRSVPHYEEGHTLIEQISDFFVRRDSVCYDLGTSNGTLTRKLAARHGPGCRWIAVDSEPAMIEEARSEHLSCGISRAVEYVVADACDITYESCDLVVAYYTVQFVNPRRRQELIDLVFKSLNWGAAFIMFEKVRAPDARFQDMMSSLYTDFKISNGYCPDQIIAKASSLKGVLEPFSTNGNLDLLRRAGFSDIMTVFKYICFEGFLAIK